MERVLLLDEELMKATLAIDDNLASGYIRPAIILAQDVYLEETTMDSSFLTRSSVKIPLLLPS